MQSSLNILHFNDVYDIEEQQTEPKGGAARFLYALNQLKSILPHHLTLFSGDVFSPSSLTNIYEGNHMIYPLQQFKIDVACLGNHDFDFPIEHLQQLLQQTNTHWLLSNVYHKQSQKPLANALTYKIINQGEFSIGFIGLAEEEWLGLITETSIDQIDYQDHIQCAEALCKYLRNDKNCNFIIALTHMRIPEDRRLLNQLEPGLIDIVLGGHDHIWHYEKIKNTFYAKSGTNFRNLGYLRIEKIDNQQEQIDFSKLNFQLPNPIINKTTKYIMKYYPINIMSSMPIDDNMKEYVHEKIKVYNEHAYKTIGYTLCDLDARFISVRCHETAIANFFSDLIKYEFQTDIAFINCGTIRADEIIQSGPITYHTIDKLFAIPDFLVSFKLTGQNLLQLLENSVSKYPSTDGRFLGVSGLTFEFSGKNPSMKRIHKVLINGEPLDEQKIYKAASKSFIADGYDGYHKQSDFIIDKTLSISIKTTFVQFFDNIRKLSNLITNIKDLQETKYAKFNKLIKDIKIIKNEPFIVINPSIENRIINIDLQ